MKDEYVNAFHDVIKETTETRGYSIPVDVEAYLVMLLSNYVERTDFLPNPSFAEQHIQLTHSRPYHAKELGDVCLFVTGVFPGYGTRAGLPSEYFQNIGRNSYHVASIKLNTELFSVLCKHFPLVSDILKSATGNHKTQKVVEHLLG
jgi:hypothetical protein|tara:strand:- start:59 stop:499 length:441 start_codon:yes stop_codon:yes gene_type:complete